MKRKLLLFLTMILFTGMAFSQTHTILVTVPDTAEVVFIAGSINNWNTSSDTMTRISVSPKVYSFQFEMVDTSLKDVKYKFLSGPDWKYQQKQSADFVFLTDSASAVVDTFQAVYHKSQADSVTIDVLVPATVYQLNLTGNFNGWDPTSHPMEMVDSTGDGKEFMLTLYVLDTTTLEYKFVAGPGWSYEQTVSDNYKYIVVGGTVECMDFKAIFNPNNVGDIVLNIKVPQGTAEVWIIGDFEDWSTENAVQATKVTDSTYTVTIQDVANISYKVYNHPDWIYEEAADAAGTSVANRSAAFLDGPTFSITVTFWKQLYVPPTKVDEIDNVRNHIYSRDGSVIVDGVVDRVTVYDIQGRLVQDTRTKGTFVSRNLNAGLYLIRVDNQVQKVLVQ
jgi:hypothetical protein